MPRENFVRKFESDIYIVKPILLDALNFIKENVPQMPDDIEADLKLVFSELLYNAIIHGNSLDKSKSIQFFIEVDGDVVFCYIEDEGLGYDYGELIQSFGHNSNLDGEHGRGIRLVQALTDKVEFSPKGNIIKFYKKVAAGG